MIKGQKLLTKQELRIKASYTVEAAVIVPLVCFIIFTFMTLCFYFHDVIATEARVAYVSEEARMALLYSRIPNTSKIYAEGFEEEESLLVLKGMLLTPDEELRTNEMFLNSDKANMNFSKDKIEIAVTTSGLKKWYLLIKNGLGAKYIKEIRYNVSPLNNLRGSRLVYRLWKEML